MHIDIGHNTYIIKRRSEKYNKKLKGEVTLEAKTELDFVKKDNATGIEESLNGVSRNETDKNIRKFFGTYDDFILTSMASQLDSLSFIKSEYEPLSINLPFLRTYMQSTFLIVDNL